MAQVTTGLRFMPLNCPNCEQIILAASLEDNGAGAEQSKSGLAVINFPVSQTETHECFFISPEKKWGWLIKKLSPPELWSDLKLYIKKNLKKSHARGRSFSFGILVDSSITENGRQLCDIMVADGRLISVESQESSCEPGHLVSLSGARRFAFMKYRIPNLQQAGLVIGEEPQNMNIWQLEIRSSNLDLLEFNSAKLIAELSGLNAKVFMHTPVEKERGADEPVFKHKLSLRTAERKDKILQILMTWEKPMFKIKLEQGV